MASRCSKAAVSGAQAQAHEWKGVSEETCFEYRVPDSSVGKESACNAIPVRFLGWEDPLEKG